MEFLIDTHALLWYVLGNPSLGSRAKEVIDAKTGLYFSIASLWEIAIKINIGKLQINRSFQDLLDELQYMNAQLLSLTVEHTDIYINLPLHHRDPFDRILVAQAIDNSLVLVSRDSAFDAYPIQRIWH